MYLEPRVKKTKQLVELGSQESLDVLVLFDVFAKWLKLDFGFWVHVCLIISLNGLQNQSWLIAPAVLAVRSNLSSADHLVHLVPCPPSRLSRLHFPQTPCQTRRCL